MQPFYSYSLSVPPNRDHQHRQKAHRYAGLHILMPVCIGSVFGRGWPFADFVLTFIPTLYQQWKRVASNTPLYIDQRGVCHAAVGLLARLPTWKYHIPVLSWGSVCNCVLSDLQSPSHSFVPDIFLRWIYFSFSGILAVVPLVTKFSSFLPPCVLRANDKRVRKLHCVCIEKKKKLPLQKKVTSTD